MLLHRVKNKSKIRQFLYIKLINISYSSHYCKKIQGTLNIDTVSYSTGKKEYFTFFLKITHEIVRQADRHSE